MRRLRVLLGCVLLSSIAFLVFGWLIGGRLGTALLSAVTFVVIRNAAKMLLVLRPFTLDGRALPVYMYFVPSPTYAGPNPALISVGFTAFLGGIVGALFVGWHVVKASSIAPLELSADIVALSLRAAALVGLGYGLQIVATEFRPRPGIPPETEPWITIALSVSVALLALLVRGAGTNLLTP